MVGTTDSNVMLTTNNARDEVEDKVLKNRLAQKKFREKKQQKYKELMQRVEYLEKMNKELKNNESLLKKQIEELKQTSGDSLSNDDLYAKTGSDRAYSHSEDESSISGTSFKGSEDLSQAYNKAGLGRKSSQDTANSFSFPWGNSLETYDKPSSKNGSIGSISTLFSNEILSDKNSLKADNSEYDFGETAEENNFCDNLGDACPYTPSGVNKHIGQSTMKTPLHISADLLNDDKTNKKVSTAGNVNEVSNLNNIDSVFGIPNFSFSPSGFEETTGLETKEQDGSLNFLTNQNEFLAKQPDFNNNIENAEADFFNSVPSVEFDAPSTDSPMNFNFNYLLDNSIDNKTTPTANLTKDYSNFSKYDSGFTKKSSFSDANKSLNDDEDDNLVVPSDGKFFTCSEIWDRITSNPKLSDLDLDNLCMELKTKARCSERGVLIKEEDLNKALLDHES